MPLRNDINPIRQIQSRSFFVDYTRSELPDSLLQVTKPYTRRLPRLCRQVRCSVLHWRAQRKVSAALSVTHIDSDCDGAQLPDAESKPR